MKNYHRPKWQWVIGFGLFFVLLATAKTALAQTNAARVFRVSFSEKEVSDSAKMFSTHTNLTSRKAILHYLTNAPTPLTERDVIVMAVKHVSGRAGPLTRLRFSLATACKTTGAQLCWFDCSGVVTNASGIHEMSVLHWKSPYEDPRTLFKAEFYLDEKFLGVGETGLKSVMQQLSAKKPKYCGLAGSRYTVDSGWGFDETPFGELEKDFYDCLKTNFITEVSLCDASVFIAEGKDFYDQKRPGRK